MKAPMEYWLTLNKNALNTVQQLAKINQQVTKSFMQQQVNMAESYVGVGMNHLQNVTSSKTLQDVWTHQTQLAVDLTQKTAGHLRATMDSVSEAKTQLNQWSEDALKTTLDVVEAAN